MKERIKAFVKRFAVFSKYILIGAIVLFISLLFPSPNAFHYEFERNGTWRYDDLIAPFDFAVQKPEATYKAEIDALEAKLNPFYQKDSQVAITQQNQFSQRFLLKLQTTDQTRYRDVREQQDNYRKAGQRILNQIYQKGIIDLSPQHAVNGGNILINVLVNSNLVERRIAKNLVNLEAAKQNVQDTILYDLSTKLVEADFLLDLMEASITPNIAYQDSLTASFHRLEKNKISRSQNRVIKGELIVRRGNVVDDGTYQKLLSVESLYDNQTDTKNGWVVFIGYLLLTLVLIGVFMVFLAIYAKPVFSNLQKLTFMLLWLVVFSYVAYFIHKIGFINAYLIPFCIAPIVIKNFYNGKLAFFTHIIIVLLAGFLAAQGYEFLFVQILVGTVVVLSNVKTRNWSQFFVSMLYIFLTYTLVYLALSIIKEGSIWTISIQPIGWIALNVFLTLLSYPLTPLLERIFGFTSDITLTELGSLDQPLLKELSLKAPGTFQHSLQVGNLAEHAASAIGANALLVKVAALYHDIGKIDNSLYFIENQRGESLHLQLTPLESAKIILDHITNGEKRAKKEGLPKVFIDFISSHHGTTRVEYFYRKHMEENPDEETDPSLFTYNGPRPRTKEEAILMMADSIEAASKSLKNPDIIAIDRLVEGIVEGKLKAKQFDDCNLSYKEMAIIKDVFKQLLKSIYHVRIAYPEGKK